VKFKIQHKSKFGFPSVLFTSLKMTENETYIAISGNVTTSVVATIYPEEEIPTVDLEFLLIQVDLE